MKEDITKVFKDAVKKGVSNGNYFNSATTTGVVVRRLWRPHDYRRGIKIKSFDNSAFRKAGFIVDTTIPYKKSGHTKIITVVFSDNIHVQIFKNTIIAIWEQTIIKGVKQTLVLEGKSLLEINVKINRLDLFVKGLLEDAINMIVSKIGFVKDSEFFHVRGDHWTRGDHYVNKLPKECIIHEEHWCKVYPSGIEVTGDGAKDSIEYFRQHINNSVLFDFAPLIASELAFNRLLAYDVGAWCLEYLNRLDDVFRYSALIRGLSFYNRLVVTNFCFEKFTGCC